MWTVKSKHSDNFGTLHVVLINTKTKEEQAMHFDEGSHADLDNILKILNRKPRALKKQQKPTNKQRAYTVRLREDLILAVKKKAKKNDIRIKSIVTQAFEEFLKEEEK